MNSKLPRIIEVKKEPSRELTVHVQTVPYDTPLQKKVDPVSSDDIQTYSMDFPTAVTSVGNPAEHFPIFDASRYTNATFIGEGGMGTVHSITDSILQRDVAMKEISSAVIDRPSLVNQFINEAQIMGKLQHPAIISVHDIGKRSDEKLYFLMDLVEGETMKAYIQRLHEESSPMSWSQGEWGFRRMMNAFHRICEAIEYVHDKNIVHLDLKPSNIQFGNRGEVWILDWGLARTEGGVDASIWCSPHYTAPERARGHQTFACDVYSLGSILFEILVGDIPFSGVTTANIFLELDNKNIPSVKEAVKHLRPVPDELLKACELAMHHDPNKRIGINDLSRTVRSWLDGTQNKAKAQAIVAEAIEKKEESLRLLAHRQDLLLNVDHLTKNISSQRSLESRYPIWDLEEEAQNALDNAELLHEEHLLLLRQAIFIFPNTHEAAILLIENGLEIHQKALQLKKTSHAKVIESETRGYMRLIPQQHEVAIKANQYFKGRSQFSFEVSEDCTFILERFEANRKRLQPKVVEIYKSTHKLSVELPVGSYRLRILHPKYSEVLYPFFLEHGKDWHPNKKESDPSILPLPQLDELMAGDVYVPQGWFYASGDSDAPNSIGEQRVWSDGFVIRQYPVTHKEYLEFLNNLMDRDLVQEALLWVPREQSSREGEQGAPIYKTKEGRFVHPKGESYHHHPVVQVSWFSAIAYALWLSEKTGLSWRLPMELEWEKAARGVDRRFFPWGDSFDPSFCVMMDSHIGSPEIKSVDHQPMDISVYGVQSCAGNIREWCLDRFLPDELPIEDGRLRLPSLDDLESSEFRSSRGGSFGNASTRTRSADRDWWFPHLSYIGRGFRVLRSWPSTPESEALQARMKVAIENYRQRMTGKT